MRGRVLWAIARKDIREVAASGKIWGPTALVLLLEVVALPTAFWFFAQDADPEAFSDLGIPPALLQQLLAELPAATAHHLAALPPTRSLGILFTGQLVAPFFLLAPLSLATVIAVSAFAGEKERGSLEALFFTPASDAELLTGKLLGAILPAIGLAWGAFFLYAIAENAITWPYMHGLWFPTPLWIPLVFWFTPALIVLEALLTLLVSARVQTQAEATQLSGLLLLPTSAIALSPMIGSHVVGPVAYLAAGAGLWALDALLLWLGSRIFSRHRMMARR